MTTPDPMKHHGTPVPLHVDGNDADLRYLEIARSALRLAMATSDAVLGSSAVGDDVRALARAALSDQERQLGAITSCLLGWESAECAAPPHAETDPSADPGTGLDRELADRLSTHARESIAAARAEMIAGVSPRVRAIAQRSISAGSRHLTAVERLPADE